MEGFDSVTPFCSQTGLQISELWAALWCCTGSPASLASVSLSCKGRRAAVSASPCLSVRPSSPPFPPQARSTPHGRSHCREGAPHAESGVSVSPGYWRSWWPCPVSLACGHDRSATPKPSGSSGPSARTASGQRPGLAHPGGQGQAWSESPRAGRDVCHFPPTPGTGPTPRCSWDH